jgi:hypothetical protein
LKLLLSWGSPMEKSSWWRWAYQWVVGCTLALSLWRVSVCLKSLQLADDVRIHVNFRLWYQGITLPILPSRPWKPENTCVMGELVKLNMLLATRC